MKGYAVAPRATAHVASHRNISYSTASVTGGWEARKYRVMARRKTLVFSTCGVSWLPSPSKNVSQKYSAAIAEGEAYRQSRNIMKCCGL